MSAKRNLAVVVAMAAIAGTGVVLLSAQAQEQKPQEQKVDAAGRPAASSATSKRAVLPFRGDKPNGQPILLRKALPPAPVQWTAATEQMSRAKSFRKSGPTVVSRLAKPELDKTRLPVILPREGVIDATKAKLVSFGDAYALNMPQAKGVQITMYGNRSFVPAEAGAVSKKPVARLANVAEDIRISQMEDGWTATFTRYGVVYSLDVSCDDINSPDCQSDAYIRNAIAQFDDVALGDQAQAEANEAAKPANWLDGVVKTVQDLTKGS